ncbi:MAG: hypothetical protein AAF092_05225 [Pseudomonadota bacterium]
MAEVARFGNIRVLHTTGSPLAVVGGDRHSEQLNLAGWRERLTFYRGLAARKNGRYAAHYGNAIRACQKAIEVLS